VAELVPRLLVKALVKPSHECVDPDDGENEPEDQTDQEHVEDGGQGAHQRVDDHLHALHFGHGSQWSESSKGSHRLEDGNVAGTEKTGTEVDERDGDDDEVEPAPRVAKVHDTAHGKEFECCLEEEDDGEDTI